MWQVLNISLLWVSNLLWYHLLFLYAFHIYLFYILYLNNSVVWISWGWNLILLLLLLMLDCFLMHLIIFDCELRFGRSCLWSYIRTCPERILLCWMPGRWLAPGELETSSSFSGLIWESGVRCSSLCWPNTSFPPFQYQYWQLNWRLSLGNPGFPMCVRLHFLFCSVFFFILLTISNVL